MLHWYPLWRQYPVAALRIMRAIRQDTGYRKGGHETLRYLLWQELLAHDARQRGG